MNEIQKRGNLTDWNYTGSEHISIFESDSLDKAAALIRKMMEGIKDSKPAEKFTIFEPLEELF